MTIDLKIPAHITQTRLRLDRFSESTKQFILLELTVPWEERTEEAQERKRGKYKELLEACCGNGWKTRCMPVHPRSFPQQSLQNAGNHGREELLTIAWRLQSGH